jgi:hypothetical protein
MTNEERQRAIEWMKGRPVMMAGAKRMYDLAVEALEAYVPDIHVGNMEPSRESDTEITRCSNDTISRQVAQHKVNAIIDEFETIMKDIRERHVDDSVCGLCEYDGAFMSDYGTWCNECPGFERDDCFKLKDRYREEWAGAIKNLPSAQPKAYTKADYIMALHKEYGCTLTRAEEAHDKALEYLRSKAIVKG